MPLIAVLGIAILGIAVLGIAPIGMLVVAPAPAAPAPISLKLEPARLMLALGDPIGGVVGVIVTPVALLKPEVPAPAPLLEAVPSMVSRDTPGETDWVVGVSGLITVAAEAPLSICDLKSLGAEGSSRSCSIGEVAGLLIASDEPGAVVAFVDGAPLGVSVAGLVVTLGVVGVITVWARAGAGAAKLAKMGAISILFMPLSFFVAPLNRKLSLFSLVP